MFKLPGLPLIYFGRPYDRDNTEPGTQDGSADVNMAGMYFYCAFLWNI
jgi:hypothetical protein